MHVYSSFHTCIGLLSAFSVQWNVFLVCALFCIHRHEHIWSIIMENSVEQFFQLTNRVCDSYGICMRVCVLIVYTAILMDGVFRRSKIA